MAILESRKIVFGLGMGFLVLALLGGCTNSHKGGSQPDKATAPKTSIEPQFEKEGELYFLSADGQDTLQKIDIELAERRDEIEYGMMYRKSMDEQTGMLFIMGFEQPQSFYMKNTYVSLDIIYINTQEEIVSIQKNAKPLDETSLPSGKPASLVLEVKGGFTTKHNIQEGQKIAWSRLPKS